VSFSRDSKAEGGWVMPSSPAYTVPINSDSGVRLNLGRIYGSKGYADFIHHHLRQRWHWKQ